MSERERSVVTATTNGLSLPTLLSLLLHAALLIVWVLAPRPAAPPLPFALPVQVVLGDGDAIRPGEDDIAGSAVAYATTSPPIAAPILPAALPAKRPIKDPARPRPAMPTAPSASTSTRAAFASPANAGEAKAGSGSSEANDAEAGNRGTGDGGGKAVRVPDDSEIQAYLASVRKQVQEALVYPSAARRLRLSGSVGLSFAIQANGRVNLDSLHITGGSTDSLLQEGALDTIRTLAKLPPPPIGAMTVELAVIFNLARP